MSKVTKESTSPTFKSHTINIDIDLYNQLTELQNRTHGFLSVTKIVNSSLDTFFNGEQSQNNYANFLREISDDILIPPEKYANVFGLTKKNVMNKI